VFSPGVTITSSSQLLPLKVVKVFFKATSVQEHDVERIEVERDVPRDINAELAQVRGQMIDQFRMGEWFIGYLRYNY
jgi:RNA-binding protein YhbY